MIGVLIGLDGGLVKFFLLYWCRYLGLLAHLLSVLIFGLVWAETGNDLEDAVLNAVFAVALEY